MRFEIAMTFAISCCVVIIVTTLPFAQGTVCSYSCPQRYATSCGFLGWNRCTRYRSATCYRCCAGWSGSAESGCSTPICSTPCTNGGRCTSPDYCIGCNRGYYSPRCERCRSISNCLNVYCTTSSDQRCDRCEGDYGSTLGSAYALSVDRRHCTQQCSWRTDSNACYPGSCTNGICTCSSGFSGPDCRTMTASQAPVIYEQRATLINGNTTLAMQENTATVYTDKTNFTDIEVVWKSYHPTRLPSAHPYIHDVTLGVISARISVSVYLADGGYYRIADRHCSFDGSMFSPATGRVVCEFSASIDYSSWTPANGDVLRYDVYATSGGYMKLYDRDNANNIVTRYYGSRETSVSSSFTFALDGPYHCLGSVECQSTMLNVGRNVISQPFVTVTWQNWTDDQAGIKEYNLHVLQLSGTNGDEMSEMMNGPAVYMGVATSGHRVTLPNPGVYAFVLSVVDNVDNVRRSRRFVFFDDDQDDVTIRSESPILVLSANTETNYTWLTDVEPVGQTTRVRLEWQGHFMNEFHVTRGLLKPIGPYADGVIDFEYDQNFGKRGRAAVPNALGLTDFRVYHDIDHSGGQTIINVSNDNSDSWSNETTNTQATYKLTLADGDSIRFWVEARDIAGHFVRDSVLVHVDSSPPVIEDLQIAVDQFEISVMFRAFDIHSGVRSIRWRLLDNETDSVEGFGSVMAMPENADSCDNAPCVCNPVSGCYVATYSIKPTFPTDARDQDYAVQLSVVNNAGLDTTETIKTVVSVDNVGPIAESLVSSTANTSSVDDNAILSTADILETIVDIQDVSPEVTASVVMVVNNLLEVDEEQLGTTEAVAESSSRIVKSLGRQISNVLAAGGNVTHVTSSLAVIAMTFDPSSLASGLGFAAISGENGTGSWTDDQIGVYGSDKDIPVEDVGASVQLPAQIVNAFPEGDSIPVSFIVYQNSRLFRSQNTSSISSSSPANYIDGYVISATVEGARIEGLPKESPVVTAFLPNQVMNGRVQEQPTTQCVFWDFSLRGGIGDWSTEGCQKSTPVEGRTVCHCDHTTNFAVLVNIHGEKYASFALDVFSKFGCSVSIVALIITIFLYIVLKPLWVLEASRILVSFCFSLLLLNLVFVIGIENTSSRGGCIFTGALLHYLTLTSVAWMGVEAANLYLKLVKIFNASVEHFLIKASIAAWGLPMLVIIVVLAADYNKSCFLKPSAAFYFGMLFIIGLVILFNIIIFALVLRKLTCSTHTQGHGDESKRGMYARRLINVAAITVLLGLTWAFGLLSVIETSSFAFQILFCVFNSLQGFFIFLLFVVMQEKVRGYVSSLVCGRRAKLTESHTSNSRLTSSSKAGESFAGVRNDAASFEEGSFQNATYGDNMDGVTDENGPVLGEVTAGKRK